jgi:hypothetical protein
VKAAQFLQLLGVKHLNPSNHSSKDMLNIHYILPLLSLATQQPHNPRKLFHTRQTNSGLPWGTTILLARIGKAMEVEEVGITGAATHDRIQYLWP